MRHWIFHPLIFYPLLLLIAAAAIFASLEPQNWPRRPAPAPAQRQGASLMWTGAAFDAPDVEPQQHMTVMRNFWGQAQSLRIAVLANAPPPRPSERGARILLTSADAATLNGRPLTVEINYNPLPINAASGLALAVEGQTAIVWQSKNAPSPPEGPLKYELPAQIAPQAIGLRALGADNHEATGLEITRIRITPHP